MFLYYTNLYFVDYLLLLFARMLLLKKFRKKQKTAYV